LEALDVFYIFFIVLYFVLRILFLIDNHLTNSHHYSEDVSEESSSETGWHWPTETGWHWPITEEEEPVAPPGRPLDTCNYCGAVVLIPESKFCWNCGTSLPLDSVAAAPSVTRTGRPLKKKCMVCGLRLVSADEIVHCPHCGNAAHKDHLLEWLHVNCSCPICRKQLNENELKTQLDKHSHRRTGSHSSG
jgi:hypothetical protein